MHMQCDQRSWKGGVRALFLEQLEDRIVLDGAVADTQDIQESQDTGNTVDTLGWISAGNGWWYEDTGSGWWFNDQTHWWFNDITGWWWNESDGWWFKPDNGFDFWYHGEHQYWAHEISTGFWFWWDDVDNTGWEKAWEWFYDYDLWTWVYNDWNGSQYFSDDDHFFYQDHANSEWWQWGGVSWSQVHNEMQQIPDQWDMNFCESYMTVVGGDLYLNAYDNYHWGTWKYDPQTGNLTEILQGNKQYLAELGGDLYFVKAASYDYRLAKYDPESGTVSEIAGGHTWIDAVEDLTAFDGDLYFSAVDAAHGRELWKYDSETDTVSLVADIRQGSTGSGPGDFIVYDGDLYLAADDSWYSSQDDSLHGRELWKYDSVSNTVSLVADIEPGYYGSNPKAFAVFDGDLYFTACYLGDQQYTHSYLWRYDAQSNVVSQCADFGYHTICGLTVLNEKLYFINEYSQYLCEYDPVSDTVFRIEPIPNVKFTYDDMTALDGDLCIWNGDSLWKYSPDPQLSQSPDYEVFWDDHRFWKEVSGEWFYSANLLDWTQYTDGDVHFAPGLGQILGSSDGVNLEAVNGSLFFTDDQYGSTGWHSTSEFDPRLHDGWGYEGEPVHHDFLWSDFDGDGNVEIKYQIIGNWTNNLKLIYTVWNPSPDFNEQVWLGTDTNSISIFFMSSEAWDDGHGEYNYVQQNVRVIKYDPADCDGYNTFNTYTMVYYTELISYAESAWIKDIGFLEHGNPDQFNVGEDTITHTSIDGYEPLFRRLADVMSPGAEIQIWHCSVAGNPDGRTMLQDIALWTNAYVYASADLTVMPYGDSTSANPYGDWTLEVCYGPTGQINQNTIDPLFDISGFNAAFEDFNQYSWPDGYGYCVHEEMPYQGDDYWWTFNYSNGKCTAVRDGDSFTLQWEYYGAENPQ
ncbi:DUF4347 domain-containing protein [Desulfomonile tiedjei]|uniref:DUF4347 domain-containing protein n=1 Tax=Desulfomonile tiedjei (strain ATCC 49306 / DSM 6799 / DCB-1) TaxID=706587 RepID=I4C4B9_DESTA|nr:DUF4347 domain-containing protein [Desulfomonile tiedjei]AFM24410.1 hypothetical protein Desti_1699 [Desulfomonile tiedjei DSM 6799]